MDTTDGRFDELKRDLDQLKETVEKTVSANEWIQSKLYDLSVSLAALAHPESGVPATDPTYALTVRRVREAVRRNLPRDAKVVVASRGDDALLDLYGREAWHFPQDAEGVYLGHYPPDGTPVIAALETLRLRGAEYLLFPATALWWLDKYPKFSGHLHRRYPVKRQDDSCVIFSLTESWPASEARSWKARLEELIAEYANDTGDDPSVLDWNTGLELKESFPGAAVCSPPENGRVLPYLDGSIDIVVVPSPGERELDEARRVAGYAVVTVPPAAGGKASVRAREEAPEVTVESIERTQGEPGLLSTSIVIPTHDGVEHLRVCLSALGETLPKSFRGEIIVVDDGSGAQMQALLEEWQQAIPYLRVVRNAENRGFVAATNEGARAAEGDVLLFLNDDTIPQPGWLQALLRVFRERPEAGAVGGKLIYPDGRMQEAGNFVFSDGSAANFGRDDYMVDAPPYNYLREVDYCSAALLATPRELFEEIGGFDKRYEPGYYEDTDYCFEVRSRGRGVYYQPESLVVHSEGGTGGTDLKSGAKRYQVVNQGKFAEKWKDALAAQPQRPRQAEREALQRLAAGVPAP
jgi:GT2 family glycosyltransferase